MIKLNLREFLNNDGNSINLHSVRNSLVAKGYSLLDLVDDMEILEATLGDATNPECGMQAIVTRLREGYEIDLIFGHQKGVDPSIEDTEAYTSCWANSRFYIAFAAPRREQAQQPELTAIENLRAVVDTELGEGTLFNMLPWLNPENDRLVISKWVDNKVKSEIAERKVPRKDLKDVDRLDGHYASWLDTFVSHHLASVLPHLKADVITARMLEAITGVSHRVRWLSDRLTAYERVFGCEDLSLEELQGRKRHPVSDDGVGNRSKAQFDEPDEPSLFKEGETEELNPLWVLYTTNYHRGLLTQEQVVNVGNNLLKQIQQCSPERLQEIGPRGIPNVLTKFGHVSMAWVMHFKNAHQPDLNFGQITRLGHTVAEQVKAYKPRG